MLNDTDLRRGEIAAVDVDHGPDSSSLLVHFANSMTVASAGYSRVCAQKGSDFVRLCPPLGNNDLRRWCRIGLKA